MLIATIQAIHISIRIVTITRIHMAIGVVITAITTTITTTAINIVLASTRHAYGTDTVAACNGRADIAAKGQRSDA